MARQFDDTDANMCSQIDAGIALTILKTEPVFSPEP
jgi:hypothetical protein